MFSAIYIRLDPFFFCRHTKRVIFMKPALTQKHTKIDIFYKKKQKKNSHHSKIFAKCKYHI